ncbi:hypothetical protein NPIL_585021 [Nephila pilipes]|uniref:Uncharacterized protein n=1 Tax=Nephila pilipes TaxID=299642 RepID=A0A8X6UJM8_NEPPI|nr:hypothetical protein NPIL_585021 [Nephila pilipes]
MPSHAHQGHFYNSSKRLFTEGGGGKQSRRGACLTGTDFSSSFFFWLFCSTFPHIATFYRVEFGSRTTLLDFESVGRDLDQLWITRFVYHLPFYLGLFLDCVWRKCFLSRWCCPLGTFGLLVLMT